MDSCSIILLACLIFSSSLLSCHGFGTFGFDIHHRFSDPVTGVLPVDDLPEKGSLEYYKKMVHHDPLIRGRGRGLAGTRDETLTFADGNETESIGLFGYLYYANVSLGTPGKSFLVALDTGSNLLWVPCDCQSCAKELNTSRGVLVLNFNIYSPNASSTSKSVPCDGSLCESRRDCSGTPSTCPYEIKYVSDNTSSSGILVEDVLHLITEEKNPAVVNADITFGCGQTQTGSLLDGAAPNGLFGLGMDKSSVPSILSSAGLAANSFSMCFGSDLSGRISFGDKGSPDQEETPLNLNQLQKTFYNISMTKIMVGTYQSNVEFSAIFDSGTSFTSLSDPLYTLVCEAFDSQAQDKRHSSDASIPFEYCYDISPNQNSIVIPNMTLIMKGGSQFPLLDPIALVSQSIYCLGVAKSPNVNIIGRLSHSSSNRKDMPSLPPLTALSEHFLNNKEANLREMATKVSVLEHPGQEICPFTKINIQLFPIDELTRKGLEKDGYNPHLELTVSNRKKISSVLKHLKSKWGTSTVALGELMLFSYSIQKENLATCRRWTLEDTDTSADVYAAIGSPTIFRLRYGWFSSPEYKTENHSHHKNSINVETLQGENQLFKTDDHEYRPTCTSNMPSSVQDEPFQLDKAAERLDNSKTGCDLSLSSPLWADSLTNLSIGALFSEASLLAAAKRSDPVPPGGDLGLQQTPSNCDSFDVAIASYLRGCSQGTQYLPRASHSSILDAEETCHAFSYQKLLSSGTEASFLSRSAASGSCSQDANFRSFKFPNSFKASSHAGLQDYLPHGGKTDPPPNTKAEDNSVASSHGMANFSCLISGDSLSLGSLLGNSLDPWKNRSNDGKVSLG